MLHPAEMSKAVSCHPWEKCVAVHPGGGCLLVWLLTACYYGMSRYNFHALTLVKSLKLNRCLFACRFDSDEQRTVHRPRRRVLQCCLLLQLLIASIRSALAAHCSTLRLLYGQERTRLVDVDATATTTFRFFVVVFLTEPILQKTLQVRRIGCTLAG